MTSIGHISGGIGFVCREMQRKSHSTFTDDSDILLENGVSIFKAESRCRQRKAQVCGTAQESVEAHWRSHGLCIISAFKARHALLSPSQSTLGLESENTSINKLLEHIQKLGEEYKNYCWFITRGNLQILLKEAFKKTYKT